MSTCMWFNFITTNTWRWFSENVAMKNKFHSQKKDHSLRFLCHNLLLQVNMRKMSTGVQLGFHKSKQTNKKILDEEKQATMVLNPYLKKRSNFLPALSNASQRTASSQSLTCWLTLKSATFISRSAVGTHTVISKYTSIDTHICSKNPAHIMSSTTAVLPPRALGCEADEGSLDQLQPFHLKQSIAPKTLIH